MFIDINADDPGIFVGIDDGVKRVTSGGTDVQDSLSFRVVSFLDSSVGGSG